MQPDMTEQEIQWDLAVAIPIIDQLLPQNVSHVQPD